MYGNSIGVASDSDFGKTTHPSSDRPSDLVEQLSETVTLITPWRRECAKFLCSKIGKRAYSPRSRSSSDHYSMPRSQRIGAHGSRLADGLHCRLSGYSHLLQCKPIGDICVTLRTVNPEMTRHRLPKHRAPISAGLCLALLAMIVIG